MIELIKKWFTGTAVNYAELVAQGAQIVDVRTKAEFASGHIKGSINIPLQELEQGIKKLDFKKPVITCCASGMRSSAAKNFLKGKGFEQVVNGGGWMGLNRKLA